MLSGGPGERSFLSVLRLTLFHLAFLVTSAAIAAEKPSTDPAPIWDSIPKEWRGDELAHREWRDAYQQPQRLELHRRIADGTRFYILHGVSAVCGDAGKASSCWLHRFTVCFDEIGGFIGYRVPREHPFTRAEHKPFRPDDYRKLDRILRDPEHILSTINARKPGVDAVSGATVKYVAEKAVRGALYTSKAVWNIAQASGPQQVQSWTLERVTEFDLRTWQAKGEALKLWWFLDHADKSPLPKETRHELGYTLLAYPQSDVQAAALRFLNRTKAPFRTDQAMSSQYARLDDMVKPDFLAWWRRNKHAPKPVVDAVVNDLTERVTRYSHVTVPALTFLAAAKAMDHTNCRDVVSKLAEKNPSTYVRKLAKKLLYVK